MNTQRLFYPPALPRKAQEQICRDTAPKGCPTARNQGILRHEAPFFSPLSLHKHTENKLYKSIRHQGQNCLPRHTCLMPHSWGQGLGVCDSVWVRLVPSRDVAGKSLSIWEDAQLTTLDRSVRTELGALSHLLVKEDCRMPQFCYEHQQRQQRTGKSWRQRRAQEVIPRMAAPQTLSEVGNYKVGRYIFVQAKYFLSPLLSGLVLLEN